MMADNVPAVQALGQCIFLPMLIIGGVAVPLASLPDWAQHLSAFFPGPLRGRRASGQRDGQRTRSGAVQSSGAARDWRGRIGGRRAAVSMGRGRAVCGPRRQGLGRRRDRRAGWRSAWRPNHAASCRSCGRRSSRAHDDASPAITPPRSRGPAARQLLRCRAGPAEGRHASGRRSRAAWHRRPRSRQLALRRRRGSHGDR